MTLEPQPFPPIRESVCCANCIAFDNPSIGHGRCMKRPLTKGGAFKLPHQLVQTYSVCDWHEPSARKEPHGPRS